MHSDAQSIVISWGKCLFLILKEIHADTLTVAVQPQLYNTTILPRIMSETFEFFSCLYKQSTLDHSVLDVHYPMTLWLIFFFHKSSILNEKRQLPVESRAVQILKKKKKID